MLKFLYGTIIGRMCLKLLVNPKLSQKVGKFLDSEMSTCLIGPFIKKNGIDMSDFAEEKPGSFNEFFTRQLKMGKRVIDDNKDSLIAPCDGHLSVYDITDSGVVIPIKQSRYTIAELLCDEELAKEYYGGKCLVLRLGVDNYHRYCYFDGGTEGKWRSIPGILNTVRPIALSHVPVFVRNSREYTVLHTDNFGKAVQIEVGALLVGKIVNHHATNSFERGDEKGYFMYGGSTIVILLEPNTASVRADIMKECNLGHEVGVKMGQKIGSAERRYNEE